MIVHLILQALYSLFNLLTSQINIPGLPANVDSFLNQAFTYIEAGVGFLANYTDLAYLLVLLGIIVVVDVGVAVYHLVMWVLRKIPIVNLD